MKIFLLKRSNRCIKRRGQTTKDTSVTSSNPKSKESSESEMKAVEPVISKLKTEHSTNEVLNGNHRGFDAKRSKNGATAAIAKRIDKRHFWCHLRRFYGEKCLWMGSEVNMRRQL